MRKHNVEIINILENTFRYNTYGYRKVGLIDVEIMIDNSLERLSLPFYQSSGHNQMKNVWYPIVGINVEPNGKFEDFKGLNSVVRIAGGISTTEGWIAKSPFFYNGYGILGDTNNFEEGFSYGKHYFKLKEISNTINKIIKSGLAVLDNELYIPETSKQGMRDFNNLIYSDKILYNNKNSQAENFEIFVIDTLYEVKLAIISSEGDKQNPLYNPRRGYNLTRIRKINSILLNPNLSFRDMLNNIDKYEEEIEILSDLIYGLGFSRTDDIDYEEFIASRKVFFNKVDKLDGGYELFPQLLD